MEEGFTIEISGRGTLEERLALVADLADVKGKHGIVDDVRLQGQAQPAPIAHLESAAEES